MDMKPVVLVVEDDELVREVIVLELEDAGFEVQAAETGDEASFLLPKMKRLDLLLTDIKMPGRINGWVLADMARCRKPLLPIIYASAYGPEEILEVEGSLFVAKPYRARDILDAVTKLGPMAA